MAPADTTLPAQTAPLSSELREWIEEHRASFDTVIHREAHQGETCVVGYDLVLTAVCTGTGPLDPSDERSREVFARLRQIAETVLPPERDGHLTIEAYEPAFHLRPARSWSPEIQLVVEIRHDTSDYFSPTDDAERTHLHDLQERLTSSGLRKTGGS